MSAIVEWHDAAADPPERGVVVWLFRGAGFEEAVDLAYLADDGRWHSFRGDAGESAYLSHDGKWHSSLTRRDRAIVFTDPRAWAPIDLRAPAHPTRVWAGGET